MIWFVFGIVLALVALGCLVGIFAAETGGGKAGSVVGAIVAGGLSLFLIFFLAGVREVPTKSVGVTTSFGKVGAVLRPGWHHEGIFTHVNILNEAYQTDTFQGGFANGSNDVCTGGLQVRIGGQQSACLDLTIKWQIEDRGAAALFNNYNSQGTNLMSDIENNLVINDLRNAANHVMGDYNPIQDVASLTGNAASQFSTFEPQIATIMRSDLQGQIRVIGINVQYAHYDNSTQSRLNQIQAQYAETAIAQQQVITNEAQAKANAAISRSSTPEALASRCLDIVQQAVKAGVTLDPGFTCLSPSTVGITHS
jgi:regulator of protease activity HflC (stomatin/prohibitin superfamily)